MAAYVNRLRNSIRAFLKHHYGHLHYKLGQFMRTLAELKEDNPGMLAIIMTILTVLVINFLFIAWLLVALWVIVKFVALTAVFPGGNFLWRRRIEGLYCEQFADQCTSYFDDLRAFLDNRCSRPEQAQGPQAAVFMVEGLLRNYEDQSKNLGVVLTENQRELRDSLEELHHWMRATKLDLGGLKKMSFRDYMCRGEFSHHWVQFDKSKHKLEVPMKALLECDRLLGEDESNGLVQNFRNFCRPQILGSLHHLKSELISRYGARAFTVDRLDGVYVPSYRQQSLPADNPESGGSLLETKVIVWCNPNAAYYECAVYQSEWLEFYLGLGYGIVLWNYRGFGDSKGFCTPGSLYTDSEAIMQWVAAQGAKRGHDFVQRVGIHGRSVGGVTACHLGKVYDRPRPGLRLDFVVADRTFRTLEATARSTVGHWAALALRLTGIAADNVGTFLSIRNTPKILMCDPQDTIIPEDANLRTGVAARLVADLPPELRLSSISRHTLYEASLALAYLPRFLSLIGVIENDGDGDSSSIEELLFILGLSRDAQASSLVGLEVVQLHYGGVDGPRYDQGPHSRSGSTSSEAPSSRPRVEVRANGRYIELQELGASATSSDGSPASVRSHGGPAMDAPGSPQLVEHGRSIEMSNVEPVDTPALDTYSIEELITSIAPYLADLKRLFDLIQTKLEAGGQPLADVGTKDLPDYRGVSVEHWPLTEWIDKMQVWGSVVPIEEDAFTSRFRACPHYPRVAQEFAKETSRISQALYGDSGVDAMSIDPFALLRWHRLQSTLSVSTFADHFSYTLSKMRSAVEAAQSASGRTPAPVMAAMWSVVSIDNFLQELRRGFAREKCSNATDAVTSPSATSYTMCSCVCSDPEVVLSPDHHSLAVYDFPIKTGDCWCVHVHCGHNEALSKVEERELRMHIRYALSITAADDERQAGSALAE